MKLKFNTVRLYNFMSFADDTISLDDRGYTLVTGINNNPDDSAESNGSGKSSIWEAIVWALTGTTIRGSKDVVNINGDDGALVELAFTVDGIPYRIVRTKDHKVYKTTLKIFIQDVDKSGKGIRDTEKLLQEYLPEVTGSLLGSVIVLGQGLPQRFSNNTPSGRKQVLEELSKSDFMVEDIKSRISNRKAELLTIARKYEDKILTLQTEAKALEGRKARTEAALASVQPESILQEVIDKCSTQLLEFNSQKQELEDVIQQLTPQADSVTGDIETLYAGRTSAMNKCRAEYNEKIIAARDEKAAANSRYLSANEEFRKISSITSICPTCGQPLKGVEKPDPAPYEQAMLTAKAAVAELDKVLIRTERELAEALADIENETKEKLDELKRASQNLVSKLGQTRNNLSAVVQKIADVTTRQGVAKADLEARNKRIEELNSELAEIEQLEYRNSEQILYNNMSKESVNKRQAVIAKMETIIKRDFRGQLLENVIQFIESRMKEYSQIVFATEDVKFTQDGNNISIAYCGKEYESLSGGEQKKLDIIIQFAIRDMLCKLLNFSSNIIVCDEIFDALDTTGCQRVIELVATKLTDVSSIFIVTHRSNLSIPCDNEILIMKDVNKISHVIQEA